MQISPISYEPIKVVDKNGKTIPLPIGVHLP
jgi:hypothetical protein